MGKLTTDIKFQTMMIFTFPTKIIFYFIAFLDSLLFHYFHPILTPLFFILSIFFIETVILVIVNPTFSRKQQGSILKVIILSESILISFTFLNNTFLLPLIISFFILGLIIKIKDFSDNPETLFSTSRKFILIGNFVVFFSSIIIFGINFDIILIDVLIFSTISYLLIRAVDVFPSLHFAIFSEVENYRKIQYNYKDQFKRTKDRSVKNYLKPVIASQRIYIYNSDIDIFDEKENKLKDELLENLAKSAINKTKAINKITRDTFKKSSMAKTVLSYLFLLLFNKPAEIEKSKWIYKNYENIYFLGKTDEDKELHKNDRELQVNTEIFYEKLYNLIKLIELNDEIPNDEIINYILILTQKYSEEIKEGVIPDIKKRINLAKQHIRKQYPKLNKEQIDVLLKKQLYFMGLEFYEKLLTMFDKIWKET